MYISFVRAIRKPMSVIVGADNDLFYPDRFAHEFATTDSIRHVILLPAVTHATLTLTPEAVRQSTDCVNRMNRSCEPNTPIGLPDGPLDSADDPSEDPPPPTEIPVPMTEPPAPKSPEIPQPDAPPLHSPEVPQPESPPTPVTPQPETPSPERYDPAPLEPEFPRPEAPHPDVPSPEIGHAYSSEIHG